MEPTIIGAVVVTLGLISLLASYRFSIIVLFALTVFGASSAIDLPSLGGASVTPANMFLLFYLVRFAAQRGALASLRAVLDPRRPLFVFLSLTLWVIISAMLLPRLFAGTIDVFSLSRAADNDGEITTLTPTGGNLSQAVYAIGGMMSACLTAAWLRHVGSVKIVIWAIIITTALHLGFAFLDVATAMTGTGVILDFIHNGGYSYLTDDELGGLKRISGSFSEASSFASFSLTLLALNFTLFLRDVKPITTGVCSFLLVAFIICSTSSAGYIGLAVLAVFFFGYAIIAALTAQKRPIVIAVVIFCCSIAIVSAIIIFSPRLVDLAQTVIDQSLLSKSTSDSAIERSSWNLQAWQVFKDSYGLGVGAGSTRASNYALVLLSNLGLPGFALFAGLLVRVTASSIQPELGSEERAGICAARAGLVATLTASLFTGTVYDLGALFYCLVGVAAFGARGTAVKTALAREPRLKQTLIHPLLPLTHEF